MKLSDSRKVFKKKKNRLAAYIKRKKASKHAEASSAQVDSDGTMNEPEMVFYPLISCVMPTAGRPEYVAQSIEMFMQQDYLCKELIIGFNKLSDLPAIEYPAEVKLVQLTARVDAAIEIKRMEDAKRKMENAENSGKNDAEIKRYEDEYKKHRDEVLKIVTLSLLDEAFKKEALGPIVSALQIMQTMVEQDPEYWKERIKEIERELDNLDHGGKFTPFSDNTEYYRHRYRIALDEAEDRLDKLLNRKYNKNQVINQYY